MEKHPKVLSNGMQMLLFVVIGSIVFASLSFFNLPKWVVLVLIIVASMSIFMAYPMFLIYKSNSIPAIEKYVIRNRKKTLFSYAYALAYGNRQDIEDALKNIIDKYKQPEMQIIYKGNLALHRNDTKQLIELANQMDRTDFKPYYLGIAHTLNGESPEAENYASEISTPWMIHSLKATIAQEKKDFITFKTASKQAVESARGLQKFTIYHTLKRMND